MRSSSHASQPSPLRQDYRAAACEFSSAARRWTLGDGTRWRAGREVAIVMVHPGGVRREGPKPSTRSRSRLSSPWAMGMPATSRCDARLPSPHGLAVTNAPARYPVGSERRHADEACGGTRWSLLNVTRSTTLGMHYVNLSDWRCEATRREGRDLLPHRGLTLRPKLMA